MQIVGHVRGYISALRRCWPLKFLHSLEIHKGLLAHTTKGDGVPLKNFKGEHVKFGLKFSVCVVGLVRVTSGMFTRLCAARQS